MGARELLLLSMGLGMDAFAVSICKGLSMKKVKKRDVFIIALFFGGFQALMPLIGWLIGEIDLSTLNITLSPEKLAEDGTVAKEAVVIGIGTFVSAVIDFVLVALVVFIMIKAFNAAKDKAESLKKKEEEAAAAEEPAPEPSEEVKLLSEIRDLLKKD